jgi:hypothetical protein
MDAREVLERSLRRRIASPSLGAKSSEERNEDVPHSTGRIKDLSSLIG